MASTPNNTQNFYPVNQDENWRLEYLPIKASTAYAMGTAMGIEISSNTTTGNLAAMGTENAAGADFVGILMEVVASTDDDYATSGKLKAVLVPRTLAAEAEFTVGSGTFTAADVFKTVEFADSGTTLAVDTAGKGARISGYISSTRGKCKFPLPATETA